MAAALRELTRAGKEERLRQQKTADHAKAPRLDCVGMSLDPGQRVDLKRRVAVTLGEQTWSDIDLTLREFGFPTRDDWRGDDRHDYVLEMVQGVSDDAALQQLDSYLHPSAKSPAAPQPDAFDDPTDPWSDSGLRLFVSHVHGYAPHAGALREELARWSIDACVAHDSIEPTEDWQDVIVGALRSCDACLALLTPGFQDSAWCDQEVGFCMARGLLVIPLEYGQMPYGFLGSYQALSVRKGQTPADISLGIFELLARKPQSRAAMARALVARWASTGSWDEARENYGFLKKIAKEAWTQSLVDAVWEARDRVHDLQTASINWEPSEVAIERLFADTGLTRPPSRTDGVALTDAADVDDDIPFQPT